MPEQIPFSSTWNLPPTYRQVRAITALCIQCGITEPLEDKPTNRLEARDMIQSLRERRKIGNETKRPKTR